MTSSSQKQILCTWEIGGELGHLTRLANITRKLEQRNYKVTLALKDLSKAQTLLQNTSARLLQAPVWLPKISLNRPIVCMADTLLLLGYLEADGLQSLYRAWNSITQLTNPDLILYDFSPTAILANHSLNIPQISVGTGFIDPVPGHPIASWRSETLNPQLIPRQEQRLLESINQVMTREQRPMFKHYSDMFKVSHTLITTFPELDLYRSIRTGALYRPFSANNAQRPEVQFPMGKGPKIIAYLKPQHPHLNILLQGLAATKARVFVACPGAQDAQLKPFASSHFTYSTQIVSLEQGIADADLFVGHGNMSSVTQSLQCATPVVSIPIHLEQLITGKRIHEMGAGILIDNISSVEHLRDMINNAAQSPSLKEKAHKFQQENQSYLQQDLAETVADLCDELLGTHS